MIHQPAMLGDAPPVQVAYLTGVAFCGSTLLSFVLNTHPDVLSLGEVVPDPRWRTDRYPCSCGESLVQCPFYFRVKECLEAEGQSVDLNKIPIRYQYSTNRLMERLVMRRLGNHYMEVARDRMRWYLPRFRQCVEESNRANESFMRAALSVSGKRVFLDALKSWLRIPFLLDMDAVDLRVIQLVRDPRGYHYSARKRTRVSPVRTARQWVACYRGAERHRGRVGTDRWIRVSYEEFCRSPKDVVERIVNFLQLPVCDLPSDPRAVPHHIVGNEMRRSQNVLNIRLDDSWKKELSGKEMRTIGRIAGPLAREYGYDI